MILLVALFWTGLICAIAMALILLHGWLKYRNSR